MSMFEIKNRKDHRTIFRSDIFIALDATYMSIKTESDQALAHPAHI